MTEQWADGLESKIKDLLGKRKVIVDGTRQTSNTMFLFGVVLCLVAGVYLAYKMRPPMTFVQNQPNWSTNTPAWYNSNPQMNSNSNQMPWNNLPPYNAPANSDQRIEFLKQQYERLDSAAQKIWERTKWNSDRITLLATLNNHNLVVLQQGLPRTELIFLNEDWTINKIPDRIRLDPQDQEFLKKYLKR